MQPRLRRSIDQADEMHNKSEVVRPQSQDETRILKKSSFFNKTVGSMRLTTRDKLEIVTQPDLTILKEHTQSLVMNGLNTNKVLSEPSTNDTNYKSQKDSHNENVNSLNRKKEQHQQIGQHKFEPDQQILSESVTPDGKQLLISRCLRGKLLAKATMEELSQNVTERRKIFPLLVPANSKLINYEPTKASIKPIGTICSYAANTNQGISRNYNEDRVSIILNITKKSTKCSFFAIYDGHGGSTCCDFLRDSLHDYIINHSAFPDEPRQALLGGVREAQSSFLKQVRQQNQKDKKLDRSGSCAIITLIVGNECYVANIGDSRAIMSADGGKYAYNLSRDHKPTDLHEQKRIQQAGGRIYKTEIRSLIGSSKEEPVSGPLRVYPGKLSVSRTFGDIQAKDQKLGGNPRVVVAEPEIKHFQIKPNHDFIVLASDGIFDKLQSKDVVKIVWQTVEIFKDRGLTIHELLSVCVEQVLRQVMNRRSLDNITVVIIAFKNFENYISAPSNQLTQNHHEKSRDDAVSKSSKGSGPLQRF